MTRQMSPQIAATFSRGIRKIPCLAALLNVEKVVFNPDRAMANHLGVVVGWGFKPNTARARRFAAENKLPFLALEDGFLRSVELGVEGSAPLSIITDDVGVYYDATQPSRLENLLNSETDALTDLKLLQRAEQCMDKIRHHQLSKYNNSPVEEFVLPPSSFRGDVLVVDQTANDMSILTGMMHPDGFQGMLNAALEENPNARIIVKIHPDVISGKKAANFQTGLDHERVLLLQDHVNPISLLQQVDKVYTITSQLGFEALMLHKPVVCFGGPFYSNWGLTDDRVRIARRTRKRTLAELFAAAYILYPRYLHPDEERPGEIEDVIDHLALQREKYRQNVGDLYCFGFSRWKHGHIRRVLNSTSNTIRFCRTAAGARKSGFSRSATVVCWGTRGKKEIDRLRTDTTPIWRVEDGFLRSASLGSDFTLPASLVVDKRGIYFDPGTPSDLEHLLLTHEFTDEERQRATHLQREILEKGLSKYNISTLDSLELPRNRTIILVPGQVESDASIAAGCVDIRTNEQLVLEVRKKSPDAFILYKPHPDVVAQNRKGKPVYGGIRDACDAIVENQSIAACLGKAHEIHTMTSLVGFEGLLREKKVCTYGQPFYCGWGLTDDRHPHPRRGRKLLLSELICGTMILYPSYINWKNKSFTTPEFIVQTLAEDLRRQLQPTSAGTSASRQLKRMGNLVRGMLNVK